MNPITQNRILLALFLLLSLISFFSFRYYLDCNDTLEYIVLAGKYASGNYTDAINSYWGPLLSWILGISIKFGLNAFFGLKILQYLVGFFTFRLCILHIDKNGDSSWLPFLFKLATLPLILSFSALYGTPDLLFLLLSLALALRLRNPSGYLSSNYAAIGCGVIGAFLFFCKSFGMPFFLLLFTAAHISLYFQEHKEYRTRILRTYMTGILCFVFLSLPWILVLSQKAGHFSTGSSAQYNVSLLNPEINPDLYSEINHPFFLGKLYPAPTAYSVNAWEVPESAHLPEWSPRQHLSYYGKILWRNLRSLQSFNFGKDSGTLLVLGLLLLFFMDRKILVQLLQKNLSLLLFPVIASGLYLLVFVMHRYVWINDVVILILASALAVRLGSRLPVVGWVFASIMLLLVSWQSYGDMKEGQGEGKARWVAGRALQGDKLEGTIASIGQGNSRDYDFSSQIAWMTHNFYAGMLIAKEGSDIIPELEQFHVKYIFTWGKTCDPVALTHGRAKFRKAYPDAGLNIYSFE